jgi:hypothetical protein
VKRFWAFHRHDGNGKYRCGWTERVLVKNGVGCKECGQKVRHERYDYANLDREEVK